MRLSKEMLNELRPFIRLGVPVRLGYPRNGNGEIVHRMGTLENIGDGPKGPNVTVVNGDSIRTFSTAKIAYIDIMEIAK